MHIISDVVGDVANSQSATNRQTTDRAIHCSATI